MVEKKTKVVTKEVTITKWSLSDSDKKELIEAMPKVLGHAIVEDYESISELFDTLTETGKIDCLYNLGIKFIEEEIDYIDDYNENDVYLGVPIIDFVLDYEKNNDIEPDFTELLQCDENFSDFLENKGIPAIEKYFNEKKPELKKDIIEFIYYNW